MLHLLTGRDTVRPYAYYDYGKTRPDSTYYIRHRKLYADSELPVIRGHGHSFETTCLCRFNCDLFFLLAGHCSRILLVTMVPMRCSRV